MPYFAPMVDNDRREFQRLQLAKPILAIMKGQSALILDIGVGGAYVEHYGTLAEGERVSLAFRWKGQDVEYVCEVARSVVVRHPGPDMATVASHTGLHFVVGVGGAEKRLQDMMATFVGRVLAAQKANASGDEADIDATMLGQLGEARRTRSRGWLTYRLVGGRWSVARSDSARQPTDGFTVAAYEDEEELEHLCRTYEAADEEGRRLIRLVAELSARGVKRKD